ncbi:hypothetical protein [Methylibium rhizosphaerae]|nr:hypothetical protein [Methylibium rhizosphaerae]
MNGSSRKTLELARQVAQAQARLPFTGPVKQQCWGKEGGQWKIFFEGVIG